jgi:predicted transposase YdaD
VSSCARPWGDVRIDYETFGKIRAYREQPGLKVAQIARALDLDRRTVQQLFAVSEAQRISCSLAGN